MTKHSQATSLALVKSNPQSGYLTSKLDTIIAGSIADAHAYARQAMVRMFAAGLLLGVCMSVAAFEYGKRSGIAEQTEMLVGLTGI